MTFTKKLLVLLEDNRVVDGDPETAQSLRRINDNSQHSLLKKTLNVAFLSTGVLLLFSVIAVVIITAFLDDPAPYMQQETSDNNTRTFIRKESRKDLDVFKSVEIKTLELTKVSKHESLKTKKNEFYKHKPFIGQQRFGQNLSNLHKQHQQIPKENSNSLQKEKFPAMLQRKRHRKHNDSNFDYKIKHSNMDHKLKKQKKIQSYLKTNNQFQKNLPFENKNKEEFEAGNVTYNFANVATSTDNCLHWSHYKPSINNIKETKKKQPQENLKETYKKYTKNKIVSNKHKNDLINYKTPSHHIYNYNPFNNSEIIEIPKPQSNYNLTNKQELQNFNNNSFTNKQSSNSFNCSMVMMQRGTKQRLVCLGNCPC